MTEKIELLAPAKDAATAIAAIRCGADAVYIGAERFGARDAAGNTVETIKQVVDFAHPYYAKVYVTLNTLLFDNELPIAEKIINELYKAEIDGLIIQDTGLLELDLPPLPLIASTQMHNNTAQKVKFWQDVGFSRAILARELTLDEIRDIRSKTTIDLECFIHGSLCISQSGQCYMSFALGGRSGNRGLCAQPCRRLYSVKDEQDKTIVKDRYLLSLKDLNLSNYLEDLIDAGVRSFKIEGRLKDIPYVVNTVGFYRKLLDEIIAKKNLKKTSSGAAQLNFEPNLEKTFNRGYTDYGIKARKGGFGSIDTPKSIGELVGVVCEIGNNYFVIDGTEQLHNADGICFFDNEKNLSGTVVNRVEGKRIFPQKILEIRKGQEIYRNFDFELNRKLTGKVAERKIDISITFRETEKGFSLAVIDAECNGVPFVGEDDNQTIIEIEATKQPAVKREQARQTVITQLSKLGNTIFNCRDVKIETQDDYFLPVSKLNEGRRQLVEQLLKIRKNNRPKPKGGVSKNKIEFPQKHLTYLGNVLNKKAQEFYHRHGVETIEQAAESGLDMSGKTVMKTKYCLREELGLCSPDSKSSTEPLILVDEDSREYEIKFLCGQCGMEIIYGRKNNPE